MSPQACAVCGQNLIYELEAGRYEWEGYLLDLILPTGVRANSFSHTNSLYAMVFVLGSSKEDVDVVLHY